jgi:predicted extracellular nuclease
MRRMRFLLPVLVAALLATAPSALAASPDLVIDQVYGGGGNSGATFTNDYVQLHNNGSAPVDVSSWSVQYASATGSSWQVTRLTGTVAAGGTYLVQEGAGAGGTTPLPSPDVIGTIAMSATAGKVALVTGQTALTCAATCHAAAAVRDYVGYGSAANDFEGTGPTPTLSNTTAALRTGHLDTDDNAADFVAGAPDPGGSGPPPPPPAISAKIHEIQGAAHLSPLAGKRVKDVTGVVTAKAGNEFWIQDPAPDDDPATSEGIAVFTGSAPPVAVGDAVTVAGTVQEFRPGATTNLTTTEINQPTVTVGSSGNPLPPAALVGPGGRVPPPQIIEDDATGSVESSGVFDPGTDGIDFWESMEGMRVRIDDPEVVGPTNSFDETDVVPSGSGPRTDRGGIVVSANDFNPERVVLADLLAPVPDANVGDRYAGAVTGILDYGFGNFQLEPTASPTLVSGGLQRETTESPSGGQLAVATFNVENLSPKDPPAKFARLASTIVENLRSPDLVALEEIQDNSGPTDDGVVAADQTLQALVDAIDAAGGPHYQWREIDPTNDTDGGQPGGNIRQAFLFRTDRGLSFVDRPGGDATTAAGVVASDHRPELSISPGRIDPASSAWTSSRKPLAGEFRWRGRTVFAIANHFNSKGGDDPLFGRFQPPVAVTEDQRHRQATEVRSFVDEILAVDDRADVIVLGDLNDYEFSTTADILTADGALLDLPRTLPLPERYTYVFEGNSQVLDHILLSRALAEPHAYDYDVVHVNSEFADQASDHEPQVVRLRVRR